MKDVTDEAQIDRWLLDHALIAQTQYEKGELTNSNTHIDADTSEAIRVYRPIDYGRAFVERVGGTETEDWLMDLKGAGTRDPHPAQYKNGMAGLSEMVREYAFQKLIQKIFVQSKSGFETIECYAVLDLGFDTKVGDSTGPAGMVLRQAHKRYITEHNYQIRDQDTLVREKVLRRYGITSAGMDWTSANPIYHDMQGSEEGAVVDFGTYVALSRFTQSLLGMENWEKTWLPRPVLFDFNSPDFVQPDPELLVSLSNWGAEQSEPTHWTQQWANWSTMATDRKKNLLLT